MRMKWVNAVRRIAVTGRAARGGLRWPTLAGLLLGCIALLGAGPAPAAEASGHLARILSQGVLRVGTTGDYKPFTYQADGSKTFSGMDIDLAHALGKALGVKVDFVKTSWPTLMKDYEAGKFDIGMGGISVTLARQKVAYFSIPEMVDGKTPITLCKNKDKYRTLAQIDQPGVRVIVNPGGTNERFDRAHLHHAQIITYKDNRTIFEQIIAGKADLMITDGVETRLQQKLHPKLCAVHPGHPFSHSEKAFLLPRDITWKLFVDQWLHQMKLTGAYQAIYDKWLK